MVRRPSPERAQAEPPAAGQSSRNDDRRQADEYRALLRQYEDLVDRSAPEALTGDAFTTLRARAKEAMLHLGGEADVSSVSLKDYDHIRYGPYLGVSDEGSATTVIRKAALDSPKVRATGTRDPLVVGVAHDAERLAAIGEVPVGPMEYAEIRLECTGRILTSTNVGTRLNLRFYKRHPLVTVAGGDTRRAMAAAKKDLKRIFEPFVKTPDGRPRALTVFVEFDPESRRSFDDRVALFGKLAKYVADGSIADPDYHRLGFQIRIGFGPRGRNWSLLGINLTARSGLDELVIDGVVRKEADESLSLPGLLNYLPPKDLQTVLKRARAKGIHVRPRNTVDTDTVARNVWTSLHAAKQMGVSLGKYGTFPLTLEESDEVIGQVQKWFTDWSAAPVFFVDQGILSRDTAYVEDSLLEGLRLWLDMVARHRVPVVLIDTVDKSTGWRILKDALHPKQGLLTAAEIRSIDEYARKLGVKALWAGGISLAQAFEFGKLGVFGIYVTSAAASSAAVSAAYERDPQLASMKEPTYEGVSRAKLLLEAGFLAPRLRGRGGAEIERLAKQLIAAIASAATDIEAREKRLADRVLVGWTEQLVSEPAGLPEANR